MSKEQNIIFYETEDEKVNISVIYEDETFWLTQKGMSELFDVNKSTISRHLKNIFDEEELIEKVVVAKKATTTQKIIKLQINKKTPHPAATRRETRISQIMCKILNNYNDNCRNFFLNSVAF